MAPTLHHHLLAALLPLVVAQLEFEVPVTNIPCYAPDGVTIADDSYRPCNNLGIMAGAVSSCCRLNAVPDTREFCDASGLCVQGAIVRRGFCTDPTWEDPACVNFCTNDDENGSSNGTIELTACEDGKLCCGPSNDACCDSNDAFELPNPARPTTSDAAPTEIATSPPEPVCEGEKTPLALYLGIGAGVLAVLIGTLGFIIILLRKVTLLKKRNGELLCSAALRDSRAPVLPPTPHVGSMQGFTDFKATYGELIARREEEKTEEEKKRKGREMGERRELGTSFRSEAETVVAEGSGISPQEAIDEDVRERSEARTPPIPPRGR